MTEQELTQRLGLAPGPTLTALVALSERIAPGAPGEAFGLLWLYLPWLAPGGRAADLRHGTPHNVHPFAETGGDLNHFGFLMDGERPTEDRPIVSVTPKDDDEATQIVAPNLRAFLGLVATAFGEVISRQGTDADWFSFRADWYPTDDARRAEMERLSDLLCTIPGVARPASPTAVANAVPAQAFRLSFDGDDDAPAAAQALGEAHRATVFAQLALAERRYQEALLHARVGLQHPAYRARSLFVLAHALWHTHARAEAAQTSSELLAAWLDDAAVPLPGVHARVSIARAELVALLELIDGPSAAPAIAQVLAAPELADPGGDFL